jgi:hypothetical protein
LHHRLRSEKGPAQRTFRGDDGKITGFIFLRGKNSIVFKRIL